MNKLEIIRLCCLEFGMIDEDGEVMNMPTIKKNLSYEQLYKHFESIAEYMEVDGKQVFLEGEKSGIETARAILRGEDNVKRTDK